MATTKVKLIKRTVESLPAAPAVLWDSELPGFALRVSATGTKSYFVQRRDRSGRQVKVKIGRHDILGTERARTAAEQMLAQLTLGTLPERERKAAPERKAIETLGDLWAWHKAKIQPGLARKSVISYTSLWRCHLEPMAGKPLVDISREMIIDWHRARSRAAGKKKVAANHALVLLKLLLGHAEREHGLASNPARGIKKNREQPRRRFLEPAEAERVLAELRPDELLVDRALLFMLATGARKSEVQAMTWGDVNLDSALWTKRRTKSGVDQRLPSNPDALALLRALDRGLSGASVFRLDVHHNTIFRRWTAVRKAAGVPDVTIHDLRRTHGSLLRAAGVGLESISCLMGHSSVGITEKHYALPQMAELRTASEQLAKVLPLRKSA